MDTDRVSCASGGISQILVRLDAPYGFFVLFVPFVVNQT